MSNMAACSYRFDDGAHTRVTTPSIDHFRDFCLERMASLRKCSDRISRCFWFDLLMLTERHGVAVHEVLQPLLHLENGEPNNGVKPATPFTREPLKGLRHKHWFNARFLPGNLLAAARRKDSMDWIWEIANEGDILTEEILSQIAHRMTVGAFERRIAEKRITGEWIIFLPHSGSNYYLCLGTHKTGDQRLHEKIATVCSLDFPNIARWIDDAAARLEHPIAR